MLKLSGRLASLILLFHTLVLLCTSHAFMGIKEGDVPGNIMLQDITGKAVNVSESFENNPVIIVFWKMTDKKSFIDYSLDELKFLSRLYDRYHEAYGLEIFALYRSLADNRASKEELSKVRSIVSEYNIKFPILIDKGGQLLQEYGVNVLPSTVMVNKEGSISFLYAGFPLMAPSMLKEKINDLVGIVKVAQTDHKN